MNGLTLICAAAFVVGVPAIIAVINWAIRADQAAGREYSGMWDDRD